MNETTTIIQSINQTTRNFDLAMPILPTIPKPINEVGPTDEAWEGRESFLSREPLLVVELIGGDNVLRPAPRVFCDAAWSQLAGQVILLSK
jgi:hypothetical protein